ncbi:MAG: ArsR family transcriptional regulator [Candidatus Methanoperedenaceae archaeon]|nr:ArsR family transcriptional regulator [Candidatus Methanoperedenaceae archaeon]MDW7725571.1 ArsR family transcriptional regulator [Candidatus Methanoperedens sp.]
MGKRTRIINEPSDIVLLLRSFGSEIHKIIFSSLQNEWKTEEELNEEIGFETKDSLAILKKSGFVESKWRMPDPGQKPVKEYHSSYSRVHVNFQCSVEDLSDLIMITFKNDSEIRDDLILIEKEVEKGNQSMNGLQRAIDKNIMFIRGLAKRSPILSVKGQRIELVGEAE